MMLSVQVLTFKIIMLETGSRNFPNKQYYNIKVNGAITNNSGIRPNKYETVIKIKKLHFW